MSMTVSNACQMVAAPTFMQVRALSPGPVSR
jgi:hypothetical protein